MELVISEKSVGKDYLLSLSKCVDVRVDRRKMYGDSFLTDADDFLLTIIEGKLKRYKIANDDYSKEDSLIDLINYLIFLLANRLKRRENGKI